MVGFAVASLAAEQAELETIGVAVRWQRRRIGRALLAPQNVPAGTGIPVEPANYQDEFKKLWLVG